MKLRNKNSYLRQTKEPKRKKKINISKYIYILIILLILIFLFFYLGKGLVYIKGFGQINISSLNVQEITDIRILKLMVREGEEIKKGDALFSFTRGTNQPLQLIDRDKILREKQNIKEEINKISFQIKLKLNEKEFLKNQIIKQEKKLSDIKNMILLKAKPSSEMDKLKDELDKINHKLEQLEQEIRYLNSKKYELQNRLYIFNNSSDGFLRRDSSKKQKIKLTTNWRDFPGYTELVFKSDAPFEYNLSRNSKTIELKIPDTEVLFTQKNLINCGKRIAGVSHTEINEDSIFTITTNNYCKVHSCWIFKYPFRIVLKLEEAGKKDPIITNDEKKIYCNSYYKEIFRSPFSGMITRIYFNNFEVVIKGEKIMSIFQPDELHIKAFFDQDKIPYIKKNQKVIIEFPDSSKIRGIISRSYYSTLRHPPEFQKKYEPAQRGIVVDVKPIDFSSIKNKQIEKLSVTLWIKKENIFRRIF